MPVNYQGLYEKIESKIEEGVQKLDKIDITDKEYDMILNNLVTTVKLIKNFDELMPGNNGGQQRQQVEGIKIGDSYEGLDGSSNKRKMVIFTSEGCSFCQKMKPVYMPYLESTDVTIEHIVLHDEETQSFAQKLGINGIPAYLFVKDGKVTHRYEGFDTSKSNERHIEELKELILTFL